MATRKIICAFLGHVDHGKTSLQDRIRKSAVVSGEAGAITQRIAASIIPIETIKKICGPLFKALGETTIPGILLIDTPGHASFTNLRKRGGSLADIAVVVVDINEGFKPQTLEALEILKTNKVPFIIAANKIDLISGWTYNEEKSSIENINALSQNTSANFDKKMYELVGKLHELGFQSERFDRVSNYTQEIALVPTSAETGQGIPELLLVITGLAQKFLEAKLEIETEGYAKGTILEVKEEKGLGTTLDVIVYSGQLKVNDTIVVGTANEPVVTKIRALLEPGEKPDSFQQVKEVSAATSVKISAPNLSEAFAGMPIRSCHAAETQSVIEDIRQEVESVMIETDQEGVIIKADALGSLEALISLLKEKNIPIASANIGNVTKKDIAKAESLAEVDKKYAVVLGFNIKTLPEVEEYAKSKNIRIIANDVIYSVLDNYVKFSEELKKKEEEDSLAGLIKPCKIAVLRGYVFRQSNPAILGVSIEVGSIKTGTPIMNKEGKRITFVKEIKEGTENLTVAEQGKELAVSLDGVTVGRQVNEGDTLYSDIPENDFKKFKEIKEHLSPQEIQVLKEVAEIKRKSNPLWGLG